MDELNRFGFPKGYQSFDGGPTDRDLAKGLIPFGSEAPYMWSTMLSEIFSLVLCSYLLLHLYLWFSIFALRCSA